MDSSEYITKRIQSLTENSEEIREISEVTNNFDTWSALKLILHSAAINMYTTVLEDNGAFDDLYYIDALAGSGVSTYGNDEICFLGSPIIAAKVAQEPFRKMYLIEWDEDKAEALERRMQYVFDNHADAIEPEEWVVKVKDANKELPKIANEISDLSSGGYNYYCFVDNQELNVKWDAIDSITPTPWGDLLINLPTASGIGRNATKKPIPANLNDFYCMDLNTADLPDSNVRPTMKKLYETCLKQNGRGVTRTTNIDANVGSYEYDMIYATRDIENGNGYVEVIDYIKEFIEDLHAGDVDNILEVMHDNQTSWKQYTPERDIDDKIPDQENDSQSNLNEFW